MKAVTSIFDARIFAREICVTSLFTVLLLVAGCADQKEIHAELAPPPPFSVASLQGETFGPAVPMDVALLAANIEPASGGNSIPVRHKCVQSQGFADSNTHMDIGFGNSWQNHDDVSTFNSSYGSNDSAGMMLRLSIDLPGANSSTGCR